MKKSYAAAPRPCDTMKMVVIPDFKQNIDNTTLFLRMNLPVEYTEIRQERVSKAMLNKPSQGNNY